MKIAKELERTQRELTEGSQVADLWRGPHMGRDTTSTSRLTRGEARGGEQANARGAKWPIYGVDRRGARQDEARRAGDRSIIRRIASGHRYGDGGCEGRHVAESEYGPLWAVCL